MLKICISSIPTVDRSTKPTILLNDSGQLRDIVLPSKLIENFLALAFSNTANNKETCGILTGKLEQNKLLITHLLIPQQTGSPDSCLTLNEEDIFDFQDHHNLITLGWIHVCIYDQNINNILMYLINNISTRLIILVIYRRILLKPLFYLVSIFTLIVLIN